MDWLQVLTASGAVGALGVALAAYFKTRPAMKLAEVQGEAALWTRITELERRTSELEKLLAREQSRNGDLEHDLANETASLDAFLLLAERDPKKVMEQIPTIREMRRQHKERVAIKRGQREGVAIAIAGQGAPE